MQKQIRVSYYHRGSDRAPWGEDGITERRAVRPKAAQPEPLLGDCSLKKGGAHLRLPEGPLLEPGEGTQAGTEVKPGHSRR